jgi:curved DNA-binding protein
MLFGRAQRPGAPGGFAWEDARDQPGGDHEAHLELSLDEAARGGEREITLADASGAPSATFRVKIPAGVKPGQRIRLAGKGGAGSGGARAGDLYLKVSLRPDPRFRIEGSDLHTTVPITPSQAALGGDVRVTTLDGPVTFRVPAGTSSGRRVRLRGKGYPAAGAPGDLFVELRIVVPERLTNRQRELYEDLAREN